MQNTRLELVSSEYSILQILQKTSYKLLTAITCQAQLYWKTHSLNLDVHHLNPNTNMIICTDFIASSDLVMKETDNCAIANHN